MSELEIASEAADLAVRFDQTGQIDKAVECYRTAARLLDRIRDKVTPDKQINLISKVKEYLERANLLLEQKERSSQCEGARQVAQCAFAVQQALAADEAGAPLSALQLYKQAVELAVSIKSNDPEVKTKVNNLAKQALDRAEQLQNITAKASSVAEGGAARGSDGSQYTEEEKRVLRLTSHINDQCYLPFMDVDLAERFQLARPFEDAAGALKLSAKQAREFQAWLRPHEICADPTMVAGDHVDCFSIKQTIVSDCSFVASLAVSALYERRFNKKIITSIIYPKNKRKEPVYNPFGKYMVKLHLNGVQRKVIIDDRLPWSRHGRLLCSSSSNRNEFWVALLEKAYMKVMGGYDFPGSNSNIDLHALTGWLPERVALRDADAALFAQLRARLHAGDVLATAATGELPPAAADATGLVPAHAYAVLDAQDVDGVKLLKLKNPWSHVRWRGAYSELDAARWTPALRARLGYEPDCAAQYDNGVFWIDYDSLRRHFDVFYFNWNPRLFSYSFCTHAEWVAGVGPARDAYSVGANPQWAARARGPGALWLLLTRHITALDDFRDNREYITLLVYGGGRRVYYPYEPPPLVDGVRINSPHYLCKVAVRGDESFTLVLSQYEKTRSIQYTLRAYASCPFELRALPPPPHARELRGAWAGASAGGCENHRATYGLNPQFAVRVADGADLLLQLKGPKQYQLGLDVTVLELDDASRTAPFLKKSSGPYRSGYVCLSLEALPAGRYCVTPSTFLPGQEGPFLLEAASTQPLDVQPR